MKPQAYRRGPVFGGLAIETVGVIIFVAARLDRDLGPYMLPIMVVGLAIMAAGSLFMLRGRPKV